MAEYIEKEAVLAEIENEYKNVEKIKTPFAKIIVDGPAEKPYYSILWWDKKSKDYNVGYSSYCLDYVFKWFEVVFEIIAADVQPVVHGRWESVKNPQWPAYSHDKCCICGWWNTKNALCYDGHKKPGHSLNYCPNCGAKMDGE